MTAESFTEFCLIGIKREGATSELQFAGLTEDITGIEFGEKDIEAKPLLNGGDVVQKTPMTTESVTFKVYPISVNEDGTGVSHFLAGTTDANDTDPFSILTDRGRLRHRLVFLWSDSLPASPTTAEGAVSATATAYRITIANAYCTAVKPNFDDKIMSAEVTFKWAPFTKTAVSNKLEESTVTAGLSSVSATATDVTA